MNKTNENVKRDIRTAKVLLLKAEAILINSIRNSDDQLVKDIYRSVTSLGTKINKLDL